MLLWFNAPLSTLQCVETVLIGHFGHVHTAAECVFQSLIQSHSHTVCLCTGVTNAFYNQPFFGIMNS